MEPLFPGKRFSFFRLFVALLCVTLIVGEEDAGALVRWLRGRDSHAAI